MSPVLVDTVSAAVVPDELLLAILIVPASVVAVISLADVSIGELPCIPVFADSNNVLAVRSTPSVTSVTSLIAPPELIVIVLPIAVILSTITSLAVNTISPEPPAVTLSAVICPVAEISTLPSTVVAVVTSSQPSPVWSNTMSPVPVNTVNAAVVPDELLLAISIVPASVVAVISLADVSIGELPYIPVAADSNNVLAVRSTASTVSAASLIAPSELIIIVLLAAVMLPTVMSPLADVAKTTSPSPPAEMMPAVILPVLTMVILPSNVVKFSRLTSRRFCIDMSAEAPVVDAIILPADVLIVSLAPIPLTALSSTVSAARFVNMGKALSIEPVEKMEIISGAESCIISDTSPKFLISIIPSTVEILLKVTLPTFSIDISAKAPVVDAVILLVAVLKVPLSPIPSTAVRSIDAAVRFVKNPNMPSSIVPAESIVILLPAKSCISDTSPDKLSIFIFPSALRLFKFTLPVFSMDMSPPADAVILLVAVVTLPLTPISFTAVRSTDPAVRFVTAPPDISSIAPAEFIWIEFPVRNSERPISPLSDTSTIFVLP